MSEYDEFKRAGADEILAMGQDHDLIGQRVVG